MADLDLEDTRIESRKALAEILEDFLLIRDDSDEYDRRQDIRDYENARPQIDAMRPITFGTAVNVLLLTDRLYGCTRGLQEYLSNSADISVDMVTSLEDAKHIIAIKPLDFLIIVGLQRNAKNYGAIQAVNKENPSAAVVMYAFLDSIIKNICSENKIEYAYDRYHPMDGFVSYIRRVYEKEVKGIHK